VTGFVGRTRRSAVREPISCASFADFERQCGGLWVDSELGYAVHHYFLNGGEQAVICRVVDQISTTTAPLDYNGDGGLVLAAADPGAWGNNLSVTVDVGTPGTVLATDDVDSFHLMIDEVDPVVEAAGDVVSADVEDPIDRLGDADIVNLVCVPPLDRNTETATETWAYALRWAEAHRAIPLVDPPTAWITARTRRSCATDSRRSGARMSRSTFRG